MRELKIIEINNMNNKIYPVPRIKSEENKRWEFVLNELEKKIDLQV
jgi:hypothetical protein